MDTAAATEAIATREAVAMLEDTLEDMAMAMETMGTEEMEAALEDTSMATVATAVAAHMAEALQAT